MMDELELTVRRKIAAARKKVFDAWLSPEMLTKFMNPPTGGVAPTIGAVKSAVVLASGRGQVDLTGDRPGWIDLAINLGNDTQPQPCNKAVYPTNTGARLAWLRLPTGCADPSARATFGEQSAEERRIIHVRQVFN